MIFDRIEWDDANLEHATVRVSSAEIEQAIWNARRMFRHRSKRDRVFFRSRTDGGRPLVVVANSSATECVRSRHGRRSDEQIN